MIDFLRLNRASLIGLPIEIVAMCFPAIFGNHGPLLFIDSRSYYVGGRAALDKMNAVLFGGANASEATLNKARGVRSAFYSLFEYLLANAGSLWLVVIVQAIIVTLMIRLVFDLLCGTRPTARTVFIVLLALATSVSWTASNVMPDIFTPILGLCIVVTMLFWERLGIALRWALGALIAASLVMHASNLPIALGLLIVGALLLRRHFWRQSAMISGALGLGVVAMLAVGVLGFKQWTITPQAPPFLLARSVADGPGKRYLMEHCPQIDSVMCRYLDRLDVSSEDFLWHENGVYTAAPIEDQAKLRSEDKRLYVAAALAYPWMQTQAIIKNTLTQLGWFSLRDYDIPSQATYDAADFQFINNVKIILPWQAAYSIFDCVVVLVALGYLGYAWRTDQRDQRDFLVLILAIVLLNAVFTGLSEPIPRYGARVIWLIPMTAMLVAYRRLRPC